MSDNQNINNKKKSNWSSFKHFNGLLNKLVRSITLIVFITSLTTILVSLYITKRQVTYDFITTTTRTLNQSRQYLQLIDNNIENASSLLRRDPDFIKLINSKNLSKQEIYNRKIKIRSKLNTIATNSLNNMIKSVYFFNDNGLSMSSDGKEINERHLKEIKKTEWYQNAVELRGGSIWSVPHKDIVSPSNSIVMRHVRLIMDVTRSEVYGVLSINLKPDTINIALSQLSIGKTGYIFIINQDNYIISHEDPSLIGKKLTAIEAPYIKKVQSNSVGEIIYEDSNKIDYFGVFSTYIRSSTDMTDQWKFIALVPENELYDSAEDIGIWSIIVMFIFIIISFVITFYTSSHISQPLNHIIDKTKEIAKGNYDTKANPFKIYELDQLSSNFNKMGSTLKEVMRKLDNKIELVNEELKLAHDDLQGKHVLLQEKQALIERELDFAKNVQQRLLPRKPDNFPLDMSQEMHVATSVGGDFYCLKFYKNKLSLAVGDVSGHGVPSALVMVLMRDAFMRFSDHKRYPEEVLHLMNQTAVNEIEPGMFTTFFYCEIDLDTYKMTYCNGGHNNPILFHDDKIFALDSPGLILGVSPEAHYETRQTQLSKGDLLFLYTDGLSELHHKDVVQVEKREEPTEMLGINPVIKLLQRHKDKETTKINTLVNKLITEYGGEGPYADDITFVSIKF